jgi:hypothetical protein
MFFDKKTAPVVQHPELNQKGINKMKLKKKKLSITNYEIGKLFFFSPQL